MSTGSSDENKFSPIRPADVARAESESDRKRTKESSWSRGLRRMEESDAFEINQDGLDDFLHAQKLMHIDRGKMRTRILICAVILLVLLCVSLCLTVSVQRVLPASEVIACIQLWFEVTWTKLFTTNEPLNTVEIMRTQAHYFEVTTRFSISILTILCGAMLALSGALYQYVFKNPIAAPTMLGVQSGINIGLVILVLVFGTAATSATAARYTLCYGCTALILVLVMLSGKLIGGKGTFNVVNMLLVGSLVSQLVGSVVNYITYLYMDDTLYEVYFEVQEQLRVDASLISWVALFAAFALAVIPVIATRFSMNVLSLSEEDSQFMGVRPQVLRTLALLCGSLMICAATIYCGSVSMASLLVPHLARTLFGAEFRKQLIGNMLLGAILLLLCRDITAIIPFLDTGIPIGTAVTFVTLPFFVWMLAIQQRSWE